MRPLVIDTVLKLLALSSVISLPAPAASVVVPVTVRLPLSVMAPPAVTFRVPLTVEAPKLSASASTSVTLRPEVIATVEKLFPAESSVISLPAPAASVVVPATFRLPLSVIAPAVVTFKVPEMLEAPRSSAFVSFSVTLRPLDIDTVLKLLALFKVISLPAPAARVVVPVTVKFPLSVMAPPAVTFRVPLTVEAPRVKRIGIDERDVAT